METQVDLVTTDRSYTMAIQRRSPKKVKKTLKEQIEAAAVLLYCNAYESEFGGKSRGKFVIDRDQLKQLLNLKRLHPPTLMRFADECLEWGLVLIDMDDKIGFAEVRYVENWRKLPSRLLEEYASELSGHGSDDLEDEEEEDDDDDADAEDDE
jgi:hypothetical protein